MIKHILFDLDNTLYSASYGLEDDVMRRILQYVAVYLGIGEAEAAAEREKRIGNYGTTLEWLRAEKGFTAVDDYFARVHPQGEADSLPPNPELRKFLEELPCSCSVLTNSPLFHAVEIIRKLELEGVFSRIFDIVSNGYKGKPNASSYLRALGSLGFKPEEVLFIDDSPGYVQGYRELGGRGILLDESDSHREYPHDRINNLRELVRFL